MSHFTSLTEHQQLVFWTELLVVLAVARALGALLRRWGQPAVVGELAAGVLLGPSVLGKLWPGGFGWLFPADKVQSGALDAIGWLGVGFLLLLTGFDTDLVIVRRLGRAAGSVAVGALLIPFASGLAIGIVLPTSFIGAHGHRTVFAMFMAVGLGVSSLPVIAKVLNELGFMRRDFGQMTVAVSMVNDLVGWLGLGVVAGLAESGSFSVARLLTTGAAMVVLLGGGLTIGQRATDRLLRWVRARSSAGAAASSQGGAAADPPVTDSLVATLVVTLAVAAAAQAVGIEAVLGAYVAGIVLGRSRFQHADVRSHLESITTSLLAPVFFATAGLKLDLGALARSQTLIWVGVVLVVAVGAMFTGAYGGARVGRVAHREALALGAALNARGAVEVVVAAIGLTLGVLSGSAYTAVVLTAIITSLMAPPLLRVIVAGWRGTDEERQRLEEEALLDRNLLIRPGRLLLPSRGRPNSIVAAQVLHYAWPAEIPVTVLSVDEDGAEPDLSPLEDVFEGREVEFRHLAHSDPLEAIVGESRLGYQVIGLGAAEPGAGPLLSPVVDDLIADSPVPLVIVRRAPGERRATPAAFARALVPVTGSPSSRIAQELTFSLSRNLGTSVVLVHVVNRPESPVPVGVRGRRTSSRGVEVDTGPTGTAAAVLDEAEALARRFDVDPSSDSRVGTSTGEEIITAAGDAEADLIVLGATVRRLRGRPFLGHTVEHVLDNAPCTVVVVAVPSSVPDPDPALT